MNVLRCITDVIDLYESGSLMAAESLERSVLTSLERSLRPENKIAFGHLTQCQSHTELGERILSLRSVNSYLSSVYTPRDR